MAFTKPHLVVREDAPLAFYSDPGELSAPLPLSRQQLEFGSTGPDVSLPRAVVQLLTLEDGTLLSSNAGGDRLDYTRARFD